MNLREAQENFGPKCLPDRWKCHFKAYLPHIKRENGFCSVFFFIFIRFFKFLIFQGGASAPSCPPPDAHVHTVWGNLLILEISMTPELLSGKSQVAKYVKSFIHGLSGKYIFQRHLTFTTATACKLKSLILLAIASLFVSSIRIVHYSRPIFLGNYVRPAIIPRLSKNF